MKGKICKSADDVQLTKDRDEDDKYKFTSMVSYIFYDNPFFNRLFPLIKQQKPGTDLYVFVASVQITIVAYIFIFYSNMAG